MSSRCVFCGGRPTTKEHVYPKWLRKVVTGDWFVTVLETKAGRKVRRPQVGFDLTVRAVCQKCNSGWMSALENTARPILRKMILGESVMLDGREQRLVATWVHKTILMMYQQAPESGVLVPSSHFLHIYQNKTPPAGTLIAVAAQTDTLDGPVSSVPFSMDHHVVSQSNVAAVPSGTNFYSAFVAIGAFGAVLMSNAEGDEPCPFPADAAPFILPVWPTGEKTTWPPRPSDPLGQVPGLYYRMYPPA